MAQDLTPHSNRLIEEGRALARDNREGGRHRRTPSIGKGSAALKRRNLFRTARNLGIVTLVVIVGAMIAGLAINGLGFVGIAATALVLLAAWIVVGMMSGTKQPRRADLKSTTDAGKLVAQTELWLEHQRPALPAPAVGIVQDIGVQLDALGLQLEHVDPAHPAAGETRKLVGEVLPEMIETYRRIPAHLRREERGGSTPDAQLVDSLGKISKEIDSVTRQLAEGSLDDLAIRTRYLDYKYGGRDALAAPENS